MPRDWKGACKKRSGCVRAAGHRGGCKVAVQEEEEYEVEMILEERQNDASGTQEYLVKWLGWPVEDSTWEPAASLDACPKILQAWLNKTQGPLVSATLVAAPAAAPSAEGSAAPAAPPSQSAAGPAAAPAASPYAPHSATDAPASDAAAEGSRADVVVSGFSARQVAPDAQQSGGQQSGGQQSGGRGPKRVNRPGGAQPAGSRAAAEGAGGAAGGKKRGAGGKERRSEWDSLQPRKRSVRVWDAAAGGWRGDFDEDEDDGEEAYEGEGRWGEQAGGWAEAGWRGSAERGDEGDDQGEEEEGEGEGEEEDEDEEDDEESEDVIGLADVMAVGEEVGEEGEEEAYEEEGEEDDGEEGEEGDDDDDDDDDEEEEEEGEDFSSLEVDEEEAEEAEEEAVVEVEVEEEEVEEEDEDEDEDARGKRLAGMNAVMAVIGDGDLSSGAAAPAGADGARADGAGGAALAEPGGHDTSRAEGKRPRPPGTSTEAAPSGAPPASKAADGAGGPSAPPPLSFAAVRAAARVLERPGRLRSLRDPEMANPTAFVRPVSPVHCPPSRWRPGQPRDFGLSFGQDPSRISSYMRMRARVQSRGGRGRPSLSARAASGRAAGASGRGGGGRAAGGARRARADGGAAGGKRKASKRARAADEVYVAYPVAEEAEGGAEGAAAPLLMASRNSLGGPIKRPAGPPPKGAGGLRQVWDGHAGRWVPPPQALLGSGSAKKGKAGPAQARAMLARVQAQAKAKKAEEAASKGAPLLAHPYDKLAWDEPLPLAPVVPPEDLPPATTDGAASAGGAASASAGGAATADGADGAPTAPYFGWVTPAMEAAVAQAEERAARRCAACGERSDPANNALAVCSSCDKVYHLRCVAPPIKSAHASWVCAHCKEKVKERAQQLRKEEHRRHREAEKAERLREKEERERPLPPSAYEQQRLDNMARNKRVLEEMGLSRREG